MRKIFMMEKPSDKTGCRNFANPKLKVKTTQQVKHLTPKFTDFNPSI